MSIDVDFWNKKRVFLTSPTSFLGTWLVHFLLEAGAEVFGYGEGPVGTPNLFDLQNLGQRIAMTYGDLRDEAVLRQALNFAQADVVIHLDELGSLQDAGLKPLDVFAKASLGTATLMELLRETASVRSVVIVSSDKVYARKDTLAPHQEGDAVSASGIVPTAKLCAELVALSYRQTFFSPQKYNKHKIAIATARIGASLGGGDFSSQSLVFQAVRSFVAGEVFQVRNPHSMRPWIHVYDQVQGILLLAQGLIEKGPKLAPSYNFGSEQLHSVSEVVSGMAIEWGSAVRVDLGERASSSPSLHAELDSQLAKRDLSWAIEFNLSRIIKDTIKWYKEFYSSSSSGKN